MHIKNIVPATPQRIHSVGQCRPLKLYRTAMHRAPLRLSILAAALASALSAHAQQVAPAVPLQVKPAEPEKIQQVQVKAAPDTYDARRDDTASKIVVNHDEIIKFGDTSVLDVLKRLPGVTVSGASGRGGEVRMRGLGSGYTQILINGRLLDGFAGAGLDRADRSHARRDRRVFHPVHRWHHQYHPEEGDQDRAA
jgi:outer membrane receptor protein involved in Fe transport